MQRLLTYVSLSCLMAVGATAASMTGTISDSQCGLKHAASNDDDTKCVQACVKKGASPVFLSGGKVYVISADSKDKVLSHLGEKVTLNGEVDGDTINVESV